MILLFLIKIPLHISICTLHCKYMDIGQLCITLSNGYAQNYAHSISFSLLHSTHARVIRDTHMSAQSDVLGWVYVAIPLHKHGFIQHKHHFSCLLGVWHLTPPSYTKHIILYMHTCKCTHKKHTHTHTHNTELGQPLFVSYALHVRQGHHKQWLRRVK